MFGLTIMLCITASSLCLIMMKSPLLTVKVSPMMRFAALQICAHCSVLLSELFQLISRKATAEYRTLLQDSPVMRATTTSGNPHWFIFLPAKNLSQRNHCQNTWKPEFFTQFFTKTLTPCCTAVTLHWLTAERWLRIASEQLMCTLGAWMRRVRTTNPGHSGHHNTYYWSPGQMWATHNHKHT